MREVEYHSCGSHRFEKSFARVREVMIRRKETSAVFVRLVVRDLHDSNASFTTESRQGREKIVAQVRRRILESENDLGHSIFGFILKVRIVQKIFDSHDELEVFL